MTHHALRPSSGPTRVERGRSPYRPRVTGAVRGGCGDPPRGKLRCSPDFAARVSERLIWSVALLAAMGCGWAARSEAAGPDVAAVGPRGPVGPDVPLTAAEKDRFARRITVEGRTAASVQEACDRAAKEKVPVVFLPAGEYVFAGEVRVPGGLTILGQGAATLVRTADKGTRLFRADGDGVRFTRLRLQGADTTPGTDNDTYGIHALGAKDLRIDHCEFLGFCRATNFADEAAVQVDHCSIHDCPRDGLGYGVAIYSGAHVLVTDNEFSQCRHALASNGALDWSSGERLGRFVHKAGVRPTHWEFVHNRVAGDDRTRSRLCAVDTHPGMDGTFVVEANLFENLRHAVGIRDGSGLIRGNVFRNLVGYRPVAVSVGYGKHNGIPVENAMPRDIRIDENAYVDVGERTFAEGVVAESAEHKAAARLRLGQAENVTFDGNLIPETRRPGKPAPPIPRLKPMADEVPAAKPD